MTIVVDGSNLLVRFIATLDVVQQTLQERLMEFLYWQGRNSHSVLVAWEGTNSTGKRRKLLADYKDHRGGGFKHEDSEFFFKIAHDLLDELNICQFAVDDIEADDVVAYLCRRLKGQIEVVSEDKDFYQLLTEERISLLRPRTRTTYTCKNLVEKEGLTPGNYVLAKAICGDPSDNIKGICSVKPTRLAFYFPELAVRDLEPKELASLVVERDRFEAEKDYKFACELQRRLTDATDVIERNLELMRLDTASLSSTAQSKIEFILSQHESRDVSLTEFRAFASRNNIRIDPQHANELYRTFARLAKAKIVWN